eukprot:scaffold104956_cov28-Tisochrysis_lutea.AAC.1
MELRPSSDVKAIPQADDRVMLRRGRRMRGMHIAHSPASIPGPVRESAPAATSVVAWESVSAPRAGSATVTPPGNKLRRAVALLPAATSASVKGVSMSS